MRETSAIEAATRTNEAAYRVALGGTLVLLVLPLVLTTFAPIVDYPNHLARTYVLHHHGEVPRFQADYGLALAPIPNVAVDVLASALQFVLPPVLAGKAFLLGVVALWWWGCHALGTAAHGRPTWLAIPAALLAYHGGFQYGFVNFSLGLGFFLVGLAYWVRARGAWTPGRLALAVVLSACAYLSHLSAFALLAISAATVTAVDLVRVRRPFRLALVDGLPFLPPLALFFVFMRGGGDVGEVVWNDARGKVIAFLSVLRSYDLRLDLVVLAVLGLIGVAALAVAVRRGRIGAHAPLLTAAGVLFVLFLLCPRDLFTSGGADARVPPAVFALTLLALRPRLPARVGTVLLGVAVLALGARMAAITAAWRALDDQTARVVALFERMPRDARLLPLFTARPGLDEGKRDRALEHVPFYAVITRHAFVPLMFAKRSQQPVLQRSMAWSTASQQGLLTDSLARFDYVASFGQDGGVSRRLEACCRSVAATDGYVLWQVVSAERP